jgi:hypothetical protein
MGRCYEIPETLIAELLSVLEKHYQKWHWRGKNNSWGEECKVKTEEPQTKFLITLRKNRYGEIFIVIIDSAEKLGWRSVLDYEIRQDGVLLGRAQVLFERLMKVASFSTIRQFKKRRGPVLLETISKAIEMLDSAGSKS